MPLDFDLLKEAGTTSDRLRELFTAVPFDNAAMTRLKKKHGEADAKKMVKARDRDIANRKKIEDMITSRMQEHVMFSLNNYTYFSAVDLAWDSTPINKSLIPLMLYAQKRLNLSEVTKSLADLPSGDTYVKKNEAGVVVGVDMPKFFEVNVNYARATITRRVAAQSNLYAGLYPWFKYESRSTGTTAKLRGEAVSQVADEACDNYGWRYTQEQVERDLLMYGTVAAFPAQSWDRKVEWVRDGVAPEFEAKGPIKKKSRVKCEGFGWNIPHPSRTFHDLNHPIWTLNSDSGCEYVGYWDVERYRDVVDNPSYFNRTTIAYATSYAQLLGNSAYYSQYYTTITPPAPRSDGLSQTNDRKSNTGVYTGDMGDSSVFTAHYYWKMKPADWGIGDYPYPLWVHLKIAGDCTVVFAEIMPSTPAAIARYNASDNRMLNNSVMHDMLWVNDQLSNLFTQLLETAKADLFSVGVLNEDVFPDTEEGKKVKAEFKGVLSGKNYYASMQILCCSFEKLRDLGIQLTADNIFKVVRSTPNMQLTAIFSSITALLSMADRLMNLSPQENGQPASHEISATESTAFSNTTQSVFSFISRSLENFRAAQKRIFYESWMALGSNDVTIPIVSRYSKEAVENAGFEVVDGDDMQTGVTMLNEFMMRGKKGDLDHNYIFTARDGADRSQDTKAAQILGEVLKGLGQMQPALANVVFGAIGKRKLFEWINAIIRQCGGGIDVVLEVAPGEDDTLSVTDDQQLVAQIAQLAELAQKTDQDVDAIQQKLAGVLGSPAVNPNVAVMPAQAA
mgnify:CR=1 FL=1